MVVTPPSIQSTIMSVIIYQSGKLFADRKAIGDTPATDSFREMIKIHVSEHGDAAIAYVGDEIAQVNIQSFIDEIVRNYLRSLHGTFKLRNRFRARDSGIYADFKDLLVNRTVVLMLSDRALCVSISADSFSHLNGDAPFAFGEGEVHVLTALSIGRSHLDAIRAYHRVQYGQISVSPTVDELESSTLKPINADNYRLSPEEINAEFEELIDKSDAIAHSTGENNG